MFIQSQITLNEHLEYLDDFSPRFSHEFLIDTCIFGFKGLQKNPQKKMSTRLQDFFVNKKLSFK